MLTPRKTFPRCVNQRAELRRGARQTVTDSKESPATGETMVPLSPFSVKRQRYLNRLLACLLHIHNVVDSFGLLSFLYKKLFYVFL